MLTKVIEQSKIDHFTKWFDRADTGYFNTVLMASPLEYPRN